MGRAPDKTVVFVTHDLDEAVFLSDIVVVLSSRPGRVHTIVQNPLARPRNEATRVSDEFAAAKRELWTALQDARAAERTARRRHDIAMTVAAAHDIPAEPQSQEASMARIAAATASSASAPASLAARTLRLPAALPRAAQPTLIDRPAARARRRHHST